MWPGFSIRWTTSPTGASPSTSLPSSRGADAANYGFDELMEHGLRYERMEEFIDVCRALWDSAAPDAFSVGS